MNEDFKERLVGTNIDPGSLLSTDYFNHFNEVIMMFSMLPDMPELLDEVDQWKFKSYCEHFSESGLSWGQLAIECYGAARPDIRDRLERIVMQIDMLVIEARTKLRQAVEENNMPKFADIARTSSLELQGMVDDGSSVVHGRESSADQTTIDSMF
jgi:hypothetical protein